MKAEAVECRRAFSHLSVHHLERLLKHTGAGSEAELLDQLVWGTFSEFAFLTSAQVALVLLLQGPHWLIGCCGRKNNGPQWLSLSYPPGTYDCTVLDGKEELKFGM